MTRKSTPAPSPWSARRRLWFRCITAVLLPVLALAGAELGLRLTQWGYPTDFFLPFGSEQPGVYHENPKFGWRFFPRELARAPDPIVLSKQKPPGTYRIFVFGESAALGDPEPAYGFPRILRELLEARRPGVKFEIVNVAMTAINSHTIAQIARDCVPFNGDAWILYMGNNEVVGPFGAGSVFGAKAPAMGLIRATLAVKATRLGQVLDACSQRWFRPKSQPRRWEGMKMMLHEQIRPDDPVLGRVYSHVGRNLTTILELARKAGVRPILCSVASNLRDCPPFASLHPPGFTPSQQQEWTRLVNSGAELESRNEITQALSVYTQAAAADQTHAELAFRIARCQLTLGNQAAAREQFARARDLDALRFRADSTINRIISEAAARSGWTLQFLDTDRALTNGCSNVIAGAEWFWDHVHFNFTGNYRVACALAEQVLASLPERLRPVDRTAGRQLTEGECAERLAYTRWDERLVLIRMWRRAHEPPFTGQLNHELLLAAWRQRLSELDREGGVDSLAQHIAVYRKALSLRDDDWLLHHRFAYLLEAADDLPGAEQHWRRVLEIVPGYVDAWFKLADISARQGRLADAEAEYDRVLKLRPNSFEAMNGMGLLRLNRGQPDQAVEWFHRALRVNPEFAQAHVNLGLLCSQRGNTTEAETHYREALRFDPESAGAWINLGNLLAARQKFPEAIDCYGKAVQLQPRQATVHLSLANCFEATGRGPEALAEYRQAIALDAALADAHFNLGVALAKRGDLPAAAISFREAARLNPQDPQAHLSLGVALAQQRQLPEAIEQFETVLRLDPANAAARKYLQTATALEHGRAPAVAPDRPTP